MDKNTGHTKTKLGRKLLEIRKQMPPRIKEKWFEWFANEKDGCTRRTFDCITRGTYIGKNNEELALAALEAGNAILFAYKKEVQAKIKKV